MARTLRPVGLDFADSAPLRFSFATRLAASPQEVYRALAEDVTGWSRWFRVVTLARPLESAGRRGREVRLFGGACFIETVMAEEPGQRYAYRVEATNAPGLRALLEEWRLFPAGQGTVVRLGYAVDASAPARLALLLGRPVLRHSFHDAVRRLDLRLASLRAHAV
ncbi:SRPBCC family protein [Streptomyces gamaensis]|uniref:SRPBCC family protein n=1 Tax=Streptomyces gamaensis TaxID=1763542 RepID=A0ABW0YYP5_9ACTN